MAAENSSSATGMTLAAIIIGLSITEEMSAADQNAVANLLFAAAQAISTRASFLPEGSSSRAIFERVERLERSAPTDQPDATETHATASTAAQS